jgi:AraC family transcriptional regulator
MEPKFVELPKLYVLGYKETMKMPETKEKCPALWGKLMQDAKHFEENESLLCLGVCSMINDDSDSFMYMAGFASEKLQENTNNFDEHEIEACKYAIFTHKGSVMNLCNSYDYIYNEWLPNCDYEIRKDHDEFELYDDRFNPQDDDNSEIDIYIPIK